MSGGRIFLFLGLFYRLRGELRDEHFYGRPSPQKMHGIIAELSMESLNPWRENP